MTTLERAAGAGRVIAWRPLLLAALALLALILVLYPAALSGLARGLYALEGGLYGRLAPNVLALRAQPGLGLLVPLLLGLVGATAPCQLSTGVAAVCFVAQDGERSRALPRAAAFIAARVTVYLALGGVVLYLLGGSAAGAGPTFGLIRRLLGPLTLLVGLVLLGVVRPRWPSLGGSSATVERAGSGLPSALALGLAYSLAFCPTLFLLFFGFTVPLALTAPLGFLYPAVFAVGMSLPLLAVTLSLPAGPEATRKLKRNLLAGNRRLTLLAGTLMLLVGLLDTIVYWTL